MSILSQFKSAFFLLALGVFIATRLWHLTANTLSYDEVFSVYTVRHDWSGLLAFVRQDIVHPPLFYVLLKLWVGIGGESVFWLRLFPAITAIVSIFPLLRLYRELNLRTAEVSSALVLIAANGYLIYHTQSLRMYSLFFFLSLCSLWLFVRLLKGSVERWPVWALFGVNLLLVYTHYFGWVLVGVELLILLFLRSPRLLSFTVTTILIAICFSPWVYAVSQAYMERGLYHNIGWINRPHFSHLIRFLTTLNGFFSFRFNGKLGMLLFGCPIALWGWQVFMTERGDNKPKDSTFLLLLLFSFLPIVLVYSVSQLLQQSIWLTRALIFVAVPYFTLVSVATMRLRWRWIRNLALALVLGWAILAGFKNTSQRDEQIDLKDWVHRMAQTETSQSSDVKIYSLDEHLPFFIWFYLNSESGSKFQVKLVKGLTPPRGINYWLNDSLFQTVTVKEFTALEGDHFWFTFNKRQWGKGRMPQEILREAGFQVGEGFKGGTENKEIYLFPVWR